VTECTCICHGGGPYAVCDVNDGYDGGCGHLHTAVDNPVDTEHRCARGDRCKGRSPIRTDSGAPTGEWLPATITTARGLCDPCVREVEHALNHLTGDVVELTMTLGRTGMAGEVLVSASPELKIPIQVNVEALRAAIDNELQAWAEPVAEKLGVEWDTATTNRMRLAVRVQRAAHLLARSVDTLLALPDTEHPAWRNGEPVWDHALGCQDTTVRDGVDAALAFIELHSLAYSALGRSKLVHRLPTPCPWCDYLTLVRHNGDDHVVCENCHKIIEEKHYSWFVAVLVREQERTAQQEKQETAA
jgi:hypothetical protein